MSSPTAVFSPALASSGPFACGRDFAVQMWEDLGDSNALDRLAFAGEGELSAPFRLVDFASAAFGVAGLAVSELMSAARLDAPDVTVDRLQSATWFDFPIAPTRFISDPDQHGIHQKWMAEFQTADDRWMRVQASYPTLRARMLAALDVNTGDPEDVARALRRLDSIAAESLLSDAGAAVAVARSLDEWRVHAQGTAVATEPVVAVKRTPGREIAWRPTAGRPLLGLRVLDLTRVVAAPMATRLLAALGAEVLRLDAPDSDEAAVMGVNDIALGKRWAVLDLRSNEGRSRFTQLLRETDVIIHGYRPGALERLGFGEEERSALSPGLVDVTLDAFGWTGPWSGRRGFDTLVQFASGLADEHARWANEDPDRRVPLNSIGSRVDASRPRILPVEVLDFGTGYQLAAAALSGLAHRIRTGQGSVMKLSLARSSLMLSSSPYPAAPDGFELPYAGARFDDGVFEMAGRASKRLSFPLTIDGTPLFWDRPAEAAGSSTPYWSTPR